MILRTTPFHERAVDANRRNLWGARGGFTLAEDYGDAEGEALAARAGAGVADISWRSRLLLEGARAGEFVSRLLTRDAALLLPGESVETAWLNDEGALRGTGIVARLTTYSYLIVSALTDREWIARAGRLFDVSCNDLSPVQCGLALIGPCAADVLHAAGIDAPLARHAIAPRRWQDCNLLLSRFWHGFEIWCARSDALALWDALMRGGADFAIAPVGLAAMDVLDLEAGMPMPGRDFVPARDAKAPEPLPRTLGLEFLIDEQHLAFNGFSAIGRASERRRVLMGIEIESPWPAPHTPVETGGRVIGRTLHSLYSPALRRAIALALIEEAEALPARSVSLTLPPASGRPALARAGATLVRLPFLSVAAPIRAEA
ncbi:MAG TPA: glycine cleavage T C-terminal barrel domain-containing protein [Rhizomicrobium sp.]